VKIYSVRMKKNFITLVELIEAEDLEKAQKKVSELVKRFGEGTRVRSIECREILKI